MVGRVDVGGLSLAFERVGSGPPLVLLHGFFGERAVWRPQLEELSDDFDVIAWDNPGCGDSADPPSSWRMPEYAQCLAAFLGSIGVDRAHVLGLSFGSTLALELYRQRPGLCRSLVLASAYAGWTGSLPPEVVEQRLQKTIPDVDRPAVEVVKLYNVPGLLSEAAPAAAIEENAGIMSRFHPPGMKVMVHALAKADLRPVLPAISAPLLLLYGERDVRSPVSIGEALQKQIRGARLVVIPGAGHLCNLEAPERFNAEVLAFLNSV